MDIMELNDDDDCNKQKFVRLQYLKYTEAQSLRQVFDLFMVIQKTNIVFVESELHCTAN